MDHLEPAAPPPAPDRAEDRPWTEEEITKIRENLGVLDTTFLARSLGRSPQAVLTKAWDLFGGEEREGPWAEEETLRLKGALGILELPLIARMIGRSAEAVEAHVVRLSLALSSEPIRDADVVWFKRIYGTRADTDLAIIFGRTLEVIEAARLEHCLSKDKAFLKRLSGDTPEPKRTPMPRWSGQELEQLKELYPIASNLEIAKTLGRSVKSVVSKAHHLGLKKGKARLRQMGQQNVRIRYDREG